MEVHRGQIGEGSADFETATSLGAAEILCLAAAPTFAAMAVATAVLGDGSTVLCGVEQRASPLSGMVAMYGLMGVFHSVPWLRMLSNRNKRAAPS